MWMIRRLKQLGANIHELIDVYFKQVRSILEFAAPVWAGSITQEEDKQIERVQKTLCAIILGPKYKSYTEALVELKLERLSVRRKNITLKFAQKCTTHKKHKNWFKLTTSDNTPCTRSEKN